MNLNPEQVLAVAHHEGPCIVTAVPGSGKTRVLTSRAIALVQRGVHPRNLLCLTFTNKAADEMRERISKALGDESRNIWISTFHKLCLAVLRKYGSVIGLPPTFSIYTDKEQDELLTKLARMYEYDTSKNSIFGLAKAVNDFREDVIDFEQHVKELNPVQAEIVQEYLETLNDLKAVDFSGMLYQTWRLLRESEKVREKVSDRFKFVLVDEFQDTNRIQYDIVKSIASHSNLFIVGDGDQAIFSFRHATPENLNLFKKDFPSATCITLPRNYRSFGPILGLAQKLIRHNKGSDNVVLHAERGNQGATIKVDCCDTPELEAQHVVARIRALRNAFGYNWKDFAILYRINSLSRSPEIELRNQGVPYQIVGGFSFFDRAEIKTILSYLTVLVNPFDTINFARAVMNPKRGVGPDTVGKLEKMCTNHEMSIVDWCQSDHLQHIAGISAKAKVALVNFGELIRKYRSKVDQGELLSVITQGLMKESGYLSYLESVDQEEGSEKSRLDNVSEMIVGISEFEQRKPGSKLADYLYSIHLAASDVQQSDDSQNEDAVKLLTIHSAKGLEWDCVSIIGCEEKILPHRRALSLSEIEEERRLMYVAITRCCAHLSISYCAQRKSGYASRKIRSVPVEPSRFLSEIAIA